ncbi:MAG TPA: hypothetical protein DIW17_14480 [Clostridiales bacterium]|jgi:uncharacterized protein (UPF0261 family)|nr:hypothetical protein [Clostridiales bacterium]
MATVVLVGTLDTKGVEYEYVKKCIQEAGCAVILVDAGILGEPPIRPDISAGDVIKLLNKDIADIRFSEEGSDTRSVAIETMSEGLKVCLKKLINEGKCDAVFGMGGSGGTNLISSAMRSLPLGVPKLLLSTMMSGDVKPYIHGKDITMMYSVTDIAGLNRFSRLILANAAHAIAGMALNYKKALDHSAGVKKPLIAMTMFGVTTPGVLHIRDLLEDKGFETIVFHATGAGGMAMESMIREKLIDGVIDYTTTEICDYELGGVFSAGEDRLTAAGEMGIPQVVVPGALECLNFNGIDHLPNEFKTPERKLIIHNSTVCAVKASKNELIRLGEVFTQKVNAAKGLTEIALPLDGLDKYEEGPWKDQETDQALFDSIMRHSNVPVNKIKGTINTPSFAKAVADIFLRLWNQEHNK